VDLSSGAEITGSTQLLPTGLAILADADLPRPPRTAATAYQTVIDKLTATTSLAA
jgi:hypothetical protein